MLVSFLAKLIRDEWVERRSLCDDARSVGSAAVPAERCCAGAARTKSGIVTSTWSCRLAPLCPWLRRSPARCLCVVLWCVSVRCVCVCCVCAVCVLCVCVLPVMCGRAGGVVPHRPGRLTDPSRARCRRSRPKTSCLLLSAMRRSRWCPPLCLWACRGWPSRCCPRQWTAGLRPSP